MMDRVRDRPEVAVPAWTLSYPAEMREFLACFGYDETDLPQAREFNLELIDISDLCRGQNRHVFRISYEMLLERWAPVLEGYEHCSDPQTSSENP